MRKLTRIKSFWPGIAWFFITATLLLMPSADLPDSRDWLDKIFFDKWVHAGFFLLLCLLFMLPLLHKINTKKYRVQLWAGIAICGSAWGYGVELLQKYYIPSRSYELGDWAADTIGCILAFLLYVFYLQPGYEKNSL